RGHHHSPGHGQGRGLERGSVQRAGLRRVDCGVTEDSRPTPTTGDLLSGVPNSCGYLRMGNPILVRPDFSCQEAAARRPARPGQQSRIPSRLRCWMTVRSDADVQMQEAAIRPRSRLGLLVHVVRKVALGAVTLWIVSVVTFTATNLTGIDVA